MAGILSVLCTSSHLFSTTCCLGKPNVQRCPWRHLNCTWEFHNHRRECVPYGNSQTKHDQIVPSRSARVLFDSDGNGNFGRLKFVFRHFDDNNYIIHIHHAWLSQMYSNLLISGLKTLLINRLSWICEGQSWWVRIMNDFEVECANYYEAYAISHRLQIPLNVQINIPVHDREIWWYEKNDIYFNFSWRYICWKL